MILDKHKLRRKFIITFILMILSVSICIILVSRSNIISANPDYSPYKMVYKDNSTFLSMVAPIFENNLISDDKFEEEPTENFPMFIYKVKKNDNFSSIAKNLKTDISTLYSINEINQDGNSIRTGQSFIVVKGKKGIMHKVGKNETLNSIAKKYSKYSVNINQILKENDIRKGESIREGENLFIPGVTLSKAELLERSLPKWILPLPSEKSYITSEFSKWRTIIINGEKYSGPHKGIDLSNSKGEGTNIFATRRGEVTYVGYKTGYGRVVYINHFDGYESRYAHLSKYIVKKGQIVQQGDVIGKLGNTGRSTGPHLHFEIRYNDVAKNPKDYVKELSNLRKK